MEDLPSADLAITVGFIGEQSSVYYCEQLKRTPVEKVKSEYDGAKNVNHTHML